ncbi:MAG: glycosyltransferase family 2 protein, partial [Actinomycetota bacterium]|nr:glycosyltransferase family 2 protein [Actinomycetota bacterium]
LIQPRVDVAGGGEAPSRWTPRRRVGDRTKSSPAFSVWEGAVVIRREALSRAGCWPARFFYAHEGIELAWRVWDGGWTVRYLGNVAVEHPLAAPSRHRDYLRYDARNRVWLARRNLPWPVALAYVAVWTAYRCARLARTPGALVAWLRGWLEGWSAPCGRRRAIRWRTVLTMTLAGRPPVF